MLKRGIKIWIGGNADVLRSPSARGSLTPSEIHPHWRQMNTLCPSRSSRHAFSLIEVLVVIGVVAVLSVASIPAIGSLKNAGSTNSAIARMSGTLELARAAAMANNTYVRVAIGDAPNLNGYGIPGTVVMTLASANGTLGPDSEMTDSSKWTALDRPLIIPGVRQNDDLDATSPSTNEDVTPAGGNIADGEFIEAFVRNVPGTSGNSVEFTSFVQFSPSGESRVAKNRPARYIKLAFDNLTNPGHGAFILRLSGANGSVSILRLGEGIQ